MASMFLYVYESDPIKWTIRLHCGYWLLDAYHQAISSSSTEYALYHMCFQLFMD